MLARHNTGGLDATSATEGFDLDGVIETRNRRIAILDRGALSRQPSGLSMDGQLPI
jgi:hypothetical protein